MRTKIAVVGAGSSAFGRSIVTHFTASEALRADGLELALMDVKAANLDAITEHARGLYERDAIVGEVSATTDLEQALRGAHAVVTAIEVDRLFYWSQDFHVPRKYGFHQVFAENGEIGGIFHALRNIAPMLTIARTMEQLCPDAILLNFSNPEHKLCEAVARLTSVNAFGLCPGVVMGRYQLAHLLERPVDELDTQACGMNHFTWFTRVRDRRTGEDLYPRLRELEREAAPLFLWNEVGLGRILLRRYGLWPSPGANHYAEYLGWAKEFVAENLQYFYDPAEENPWQTGRIPAPVYTINWANTSARERDAPPTTLDEALVEQVEGAAVGLGVAILEGYRCGVERDVAAANVVNRGAVANLPDDMVVEIPVTVADGELRRHDCGALPEGVAGVIRNHGTIHQLIVEAYVERSKEKLLHALLLEPIVDSYSRAVLMMEEMLELQRDVLPELR